MSDHRLPVTQAAIAVVERRGRVLIARRLSTDHLGGVWEFPGGKRRVGETWTACLRRELAEELGLRVASPRRIATIRFRYPDRRVYLAVFRCMTVRGIPSPRRGQALRWVARQALGRYRYPAANRELVARLSGRAATELRQQCSPAALG